MSSHWSYDPEEDLMDRSLLHGPSKSVLQDIILAVSSEDGIVYTQLNALEKGELLHSYIENLIRSRLFWKTVAITSLLIVFLQVILQPHLVCYEDNTCSIITTLGEMPLKGDN